MKFRGGIRGGMNGTKTHRGSEGQHRKEEEAAIRSGERKKGEVFNDGPLTTVTDELTGW